jgi:serine/threonine-protein kinase
MELLEGGDLEMELRRRGPLPIAEAVQYVLQACSALQEAHELGLVHRDVKPTNVFLATEGRTRVVKVLDFGIAADAPLTDDVRLTRTESVLGTPLYMAPEQFRSAKDVDARADIWALGATLYELVTGAAPFTGSTTTIGVAIVSDDVRPIEALRPDTPPPLRAAILRALEKDRAKRFPSMLAFAEALRPFGEGVVIAPRSSAHSYHEVAQVGRADTVLEGTPAPATLPEAGAAQRASEPRPATASAVTRESEPPGPRASPRRWPFVVAAVAVVAAGALVLRGREAARPIPPDAPSVVGPPSSAPPAPSPPQTPAEYAASPTAVARTDASPPAGAAAPGRKGSARSAPAKPASPQTPTPPSSPPHAAPDPSHPLFFPK